MSANFWTSSHYQQWLLTKEDLLFYRREDLTILSEDEYKKMVLFYGNLIESLGEKLQLRQQVVATALIYFKRFYCVHSLRAIDPMLMSPTTLFLASKVEEFGLISTNKLVSTCVNILKSHYEFAWSQFPYSALHIQKCEFYLLEAMDCCMVVFQPYRPMLLYAQDIPNCPPQVTTTAWQIINDCVKSDLVLVYPPYLIAIACLHIACVTEKFHTESRGWFADLNVDMEKILQLTREIFEFADLVKGFNEAKEAPTILLKIPQQRTPSQNQNQVQNVQGHE